MTGTSAKYEPGIYFHGTGVSRQPSILRDGFKGEWTYITDDEETAQDFVVMAPDMLGEPGVIMAVRLLKGAEPLAEDGMDADAYPSKMVIPVEWTQPSSKSRYREQPTTGKKGGKRKHGSPAGVGKLRN